jgi:hypothetical protein
MLARNTLQTVIISKHFMHILVLTYQNRGHREQRKSLIRMLRGKEERKGAASDKNDNTSDSEE